MSLNFVKSSILSSSDGIDFNNETLLDSDEAKRSREAGDKGYVKPLYLQLAERKAAEEVSNTIILLYPHRLSLRFDSVLTFFFHYF